MAEGSAIRAGRCFVELFADSSKLRRGLTSAGKMVQSWGQSVSDAGKKALAASTGAIGAMVATSGVFMSSGGALSKLADQTGIAGDDLSALQYAAEQTGNSFEDLSSFLGNYQKKIGEAIAGNEEARTAFAQLGLSIGALRKMTGTEKVEALADALAKIEDPTRRAALAAKVGAENMQSLLRLGGGGIRGLEQQGRDTGGVASKEQIAAAVELRNTWASLKSSAMGLVFSIGSALAPSMREAADTVRGVVKGVSAWIKANPEAIALAFKIATASAAAAAGLFVAGKAIAFVGSAIVASASLAASVVALISSPLGFIAVEYTAIGVALGVMFAKSAEGKAALQSLGNAMHNLLKTGKDTFGGISDAVKAGDLELAMKIAGAGLNVAFMEAIQGLKGAWAEFGDWLQTETLRAFNVLLGIFEKKSEAIKDFFKNPFYGEIRHPSMGPSDRDREIDARRNAADRALLEESDTRRRDRGNNKAEPPELIAAREELKRLAEEARKKAEANKANFKNNLTGAQNSALGFTPTGESAGTFNAAAVASLGGASGVETRLDDVNRNLEKLLNEARNGGIVFG